MRAQNPGEAFRASYRQTLVEDQAAEGATTGGARGDAAERGEVWTN
jgi:hypothetical protein